MNPWFFNRLKIISVINREITPLSDLYQDISLQDALKDPVFIIENSYEQFFTKTIPSFSDIEFGKFCTSLEAALKRKLPALNQQEISFLQISLDTEGKNKKKYLEVLKLLLMSNHVFDLSILCSEKDVLQDLNNITPKYSKLRGFHIKNSVLSKKSIKKFFSKNTRLLHLTLESININSKTLCYLFNTLKKSNLKIINIKNTCIPTESYLSLSLLIKHLKPLKSITFSCCNIANKYMDILETASFERPNHDPFEINFT